MKIFSSLHHHRCRRLALQVCFLIGLGLCSCEAFGFSIQDAGPIKIVSWGVTDAVLQASSDLRNKSWTNFPGMTSPYYAPGLAPQMFFRLVYGVAGPAPSNSPPRVNNFYVSTLHDQFLAVNVPGVLTNASDPNQMAVSATLGSPPANGTVTLNADGSFTYTPNSGFIGTDSFTFRGVDEVTSSPPATVYITVTNSAPTAQNDFYAVPSNQVLNVTAPGVLANDSDPDGDPITAVLQAGPVNGALTLAPNGSFTYIPNSGFTGPDLFTYQVTDGLSPGNIATVTIMVHGADAPPQAGSFAYQIVHGQLLTVSAPGVLALASDPNGDYLTASLLTAPSNGTLNFNANGSFTYSPHGNFVGADSFVYTVSDGVSNSLPGVVTINVTASQPVAQGDVYYVHQNTILTAPTSGVLLNDIDPDNLTLSASLGTSPVNGTLVLNSSGSFTYSPNTNFSGTDSFTYQATDGVTSSAPATVTIFVTNRPPVAVADSYGVHTNTPLQVPAPGVLLNDSDPDGDALSAVLVSGPVNGVLTLGGDGSFVYTPQNGFIGTDIFTYAANDGLTSSAPVTVTLTIHATNAPPVSDPAEYVIRPGDTLTVDAYGSILLDDSDTDGDPLTAQLISGPSHGSLTFNTNGTFTYIPNSSFYGLDSFVYQPYDGLTAGSQTPVIIIVTNSAPVAQPDQYSVHFNTTLTVEPPGLLENDGDADDDELTATVASPPANGTLDLDEDGGFTYTPNTNFTGTDSFTYVASDGISSSGVTTVTVSVTDTAPTANADDYQTTVNTTLNATADTGVLANDDDADFDSLSASLLAAPIHGTLSLQSDGSFNYTPNGGFTGTDSFTYTASDGLLSSAPATVTITVASQNVVVVKPNAGGQPSLTIQQVTFTGGYPVLPDTPGFFGQPLNFSAPQFLELSGSGLFNPFFPGDRAFPYIYTNSSSLTLQAKFVARSIPFGDTVRLRADVKDFAAAGGPVIATIGGGILAGGGGVPAFIGGGLVSTGRRAITADLPFADEATFYDLRIVWQFRLFDVNGNAIAGQGWTACNGLSQNTIYRTFKSPKGPTYLTLVDDGCKAAQAVGGSDDTRAILNALWAQKFVPKTAKRVDGAALHYYGRWNPAFHIHSIPGLLSTLDGECDTWAQFMIGALLAQGIDIGNFVGVKPNTRNGEALLVKKWAFGLPARAGEYPWVNFSQPVALGDSIYPNFGFFGTWQYIWLVPPVAPLPKWTYPPGVLGVNGGQNQPNPIATFYNHCIVRIGDAGGRADNQYYDPSYGSTYADLMAMENTALDGFYRAHGFTTQFDIRASTGNGGVVIPPNPNFGIPRLPLGNLLERNSPFNLQFFVGANAFAPAQDGQPDDTALGGGASAPVKTAAGNPIKVWLVDSYGRVVKSNPYVTIIIGNNPSGASLTNPGGGALNPANRITVQAVNGVATFPAININGAGDAFTLRAYVSTMNGSSLATAVPTVSQMFDIGP